MWFYYAFIDENCNTPLDEDLSAIIICYFVISLLIFCPIFFSCCDEFSRGNITFSWILYTIGKTVIIIIMLCYVHSDLSGIWNDKVCPNQYILSIFWIIFNYMQLVYSWIFVSLQIIHAWC